MKKEYWVKNVDEQFDPLQESVGRIIDRAVKDGWQVHTFKKEGKWEYNVLFEREVGEGK